MNIIGPKLKNCDEFEEKSIFKFKSELTDRELKLTFDEKEIFQESEPNYDSLPKCLNIPKIGTQNSSKQEDINEIQLNTKINIMNSTSQNILSNNNNLSVKEKKSNKNLFTIFKKAKYFANKIKKSIISLETVLYFSGL